jgi:Sel1 repeat
MKTGIICICLLTSISVFAQYGVDGRYLTPPSPSVSDTIRNPSPEAQQAVADRQAANEEANYQYLTALAEQQQQTQEAQQALQDKIDGLKSDVEKKKDALSRAQKFPDELKASIMAEKKNIPENPWRTIDGAACYIKTDANFRKFYGKVIQTTSDGLLIALPGFSDDNFLLKNYPFRCADNSTIEFNAKWGDLYSYTTVLGANKTVNSLDYGAPCQRPLNADAIEKAAQQLTESDNEAITAAQKDIVVKEQDLESSKKSLQDFLDAIEAVKQKIADKKREQEAKEFKYVYADATNGMPSMQYNLALRYLKGMGCATNKDLAIEWLKKSAAQGYLEASNKLAVLNLTASQ